MKGFLFYCISFLPLTATSQSAWTVYLGERMDSVYKKGYTRLESEGGFHYRHCSAYLFLHEPGVQESSEQHNRDGLVLAGKTTRHYSYTGEIRSGTSSDSIRTRYSARTDVVHIGRSATLSVINLFSKKEDRDKQEPRDEIRAHSITGTIHSSDAEYHFSRNWLQWGADTLWVMPVAKIRKRKNNKIKDAAGSEGLELLYRDKCIAALNYLEDPHEYYISTALSPRERAVIVAFFQVRDLIIKPPEYN